MCRSLRATKVRILPCPYFYVKIKVYMSLGQAAGQVAHVAQSVEHVLGKDEVTSSILVVGSISGSNSVARVTAFQAVGRGFESRLPLLDRINHIRKLEKVHV